MANIACARSSAYLDTALNEIQSLGRSEESSLNVTHRSCLLTQHVPLARILNSGLDSGLQSSIHKPRTQGQVNQVRARRETAGLRER